MHAWALEAQRRCGGRVTRAETIHLTLAFLGEVGERFLPDLKRLSAGSEHHLLPIERSGYWAHNRIVWAGPHETPAPLVLLVEDLRKKLAEQNFRTEKRPFAAHITLIRKAREPSVLPQLPALDWPVEEFVLVRSLLEAQGPRYEVVGQYPLR